jgi:hypothetical protein
MSRVSVATVFAGSFLLAAMAVFWAVATVGARLGVDRITLESRLALGAALLLSMVMVDLRAMRASTYCPIGWRRQTPRGMLRRHHQLLVATFWGIDTGLVVTTFRVAAVSWGALMLAGLNLSPRWVGAAYALGFLVPFTVLTLRTRLGSAARAGVAMDPGLESMLRLRSFMQGTSAALLAVTAALFAISLSV